MKLGRLTWSQRWGFWKARAGWRWAIVFWEFLAAILETVGAPHQATQCEDRATRISRAYL